LQGFVLYSGFSPDSSGNPFYFFLEKSPSTALRVTKNKKIATDSGIGFKKKIPISFFLNETGLLIFVC